MNEVLRRHELTFLLIIQRWNKLIPYLNKPFTETAYALQSKIPIGQCTVKYIYSWLWNQCYSYVQLIQRNHPMFDWKAIWENLAGMRNFTQLHQFAFQAIHIHIRHSYKTILNRINRKSFSNYNLEYIIDFPAFRVFSKARRRLIFWVTTQKIDVLLNRPYLRDVEY